MESDAPTLSELRSDKIVNKYLERAETCSVEEAEKFIDMINKNIEKNKSFYWALALHHEPHLIGTICFWNFSEDKTTAEIGYELSTKYHGQGLMTEAVKKAIEFGKEKLHLNKVTAFTHKENKASTALLKKNGFKRDENLEEQVSINEALGSFKILSLDIMDK